MSQHPIVHIEFSAKDREAAGKFYSDAFGWQIQQIPEMNYATFEAKGGPGGGFNPVNDQNPAGTILVYIDSKDRLKLFVLAWRRRQNYVLWMTTMVGQ